MNIIPDESTYTILLTVMSAVGAFVSWFATIFPKFNTWYAGLTNEQKQALMIGGGLVATLIVVGLSCGGVIGAYACTSIGDALLKVAVSFIAYVVGNQSVDRITPKPASVKAANIAGNVKRGLG